MYYLMFSVWLIIHPFHNFNSGLTNLLLNLEHRWVIISDCFVGVVIDTCLNFNDGLTNPYLYVRPKAKLNAKGVKGVYLQKYVSVFLLSFTAIW